MVDADGENLRRAVNVLNSGHNRCTHMMEQKENETSRPRNKSAWNVSLSDYDSRIQLTFD